MTELHVTPVRREERISSVDVLRGFSLLGILLMNIVGFGLPRAYDDPTLMGGATGANLAVWLVNTVLFEGKMRAIFSMLFGAGVIIMTSRAERSGGEATIADIYYRRTLWLLVFGIVHAYVFWPGDILYYYAMCGLMLYPMRKLTPKALLIAGLCALAVMIPKNISQANELRTKRDEGVAAMQAAAAGQKLTEKQITAQKAWQDTLKDMKPTPKDMEPMMQANRAGFVSWFLFKIPRVVRSQSLQFYREAFWDVMGMMLIGMGLMKAGVFSAARSYRFYAWMALLGYGAGLPINLYAANLRIATNFEPVTMAYSYIPYDMARLTMALAHMAVLMMICKAGVLGLLTSRLAAVGQMALTNYLTDTVVCTTIYNGYGFGLFGRVQRYELYYVVAGLWIFQMLVSPIWLAHFRFGPMEWVWRSLTYWKRQPMRLQQTEEPTLAAAAAS